MKWLQWAIDNAWTLIIVGTVVAQLFQAVFKKKGGEVAGETEQPKEFEFEDPELAERTRKIREEIQRKIEQRSRGYSEPTAAETEVPPPIIREVTKREAAYDPETSRMESRRHAEIIEEQAEWEEKLREAKRMKAAIEKRTAFEAATVDQSVVAMSASRGAMLADLKNPDGLRRAFVLREVLGPPVALR